VIGLIGLSWTLVTFLTLPVLVSRDVSAFDAVKESAETFKKTWGEQVVATVGIGLATFMIFLLMGLIAIPLIIVAASIGEVAVLPLVLSLGGGFLLLALVSSALKGV
jgi:membrane-anchored glycerophosphoryl diester phosphodiesterase (GDPDase)